MHSDNVSTGRISSYAGRRNQVIDDSTQAATMRAFIERLESFPLLSDFYTSHILVHVLAFIPLLLHDASDRTTSDQARRCFRKIRSGSPVAACLVTGTLKGAIL